MCKDRDTRFHEDRCKKRLEIEESTLKKIEGSRNGLVGIIKFYIKRPSKSRKYMFYEHGVTMYK